MEHNYLHGEGGRKKGRFYVTVSYTCSNCGLHKDQTRNNGAFYYTAEKKYNEEPACETLRGEALDRILDGKYIYNPKNQEMEQRHTPGPWFAVEYSGYHNLHDSDQYGGTNILDEDECAKAEHNAKLAAAAPELLEALVDVLRFLEANVSDACTLAEYHAAQDAISKATK